MICWDRLGEDSVIGIFDESEIARLRNYATGLRLVLDARTSEDAAHDRRPAQHPDVLRMLHHKLNVVLATLPDEGGLVELGAFTEIFAWLWILTDLRVLMAECVEESNASDVLPTIDWLDTVADTLLVAATKQIEPVADYLVGTINEACG